jgi:hypothetical protein
MVEISKIILNVSRKFKHNRGIKKLSYLFNKYLKKVIHSEKDYIYLLGEKVLSHKKFLHLNGKKIEANLAKYQAAKYSDNLQKFPSVKSQKNYEVTVIVSLYKSDKYLDAFLYNLRSQSVFTKLEVVFVLVQGSQFEVNILTNFCKNFKNANLIEVKTRINLYQAWNIAISNSSAPLITNMNVDDCRRKDSIEIQTSCFNQNPSISVVYQDIFFIYDHRLNWKGIEEFGTRTNLPPVNLTDLIKFRLNSPHNAPMWKRSLHDELGLFDEIYASAGDFDFWIRCVLANKCFAKSSTAHVAYLINENGISTNQFSSSTFEEAAICEKYILQLERHFETEDDLMHFEIDSKIYLINSFLVANAEKFTLNFINNFKELNK